MPELPEVETMAAGLRSELLGRSLLKVEVIERTVLRGTSLREVSSLEGARLIGLTRSGKFLLFHFSSGSVLLAHLKMTGRFRLVGRDEEPGRWERIHLVFEGWENKLSFVDPRRFGYLALIPPGREGPVPLLYELGPDALKVSRQELREILGRSRRPVKALLLDQRAVAGLGNIYVDESLHRAGIHPATPAAQVPPERVKALHGAIRRVLRHAIRCGGSSVSSFHDSRGRRGSYQYHHHVYKREGESCRSCSTTIRYVRLASRGTRFCPSCQPTPEVAAGKGGRDARGRSRTKAQSRRLGT